jgi:succinyl-CoA synthetase beta subunit
VSRKKLSEFRAKTLIFDALGQPYQGVELDAKADWQSVVAGLDDSLRYVVKVDQAEKGRFKKGLVKLDQDKTGVSQSAKEIFDKGYEYVLVEPHRQHDAADERYLTLERLREGNKLAYSEKGGVDIESHADAIKSELYKGQAVDGVAMPADNLSTLNQLFDNNYFSFLEINPYTYQDGQLNILDAAVEVDEEAAFFEDGWQTSDLRSPRSGSITDEELVVKELADNSQASFSLEVINPDGAIWLLLSGGGASVVVADEVHNLGYGKQLGNYGEYSGNPNTEETQHYTEQVISLMLKSKANHKALIIAGGVANFTDVRATFKGVIAALKAHEAELKQQGCAVYVRRGGPHEKEGLQLMRDYLEQAGIKNQVVGPEVLLSDIVGQAVQEVDK